MKPLACDTRRGIYNNNKCNIPVKSHFHLIGALNPGESKESKGWLVIAASTPGQLSLSHKQLHIFNLFCPKKIPTDCIDCVKRNWKESPLIKVENEKEKFAISEKPEILLISVDQMTGGITIENCVRLGAETFTSGNTENLQAGMEGSSISPAQWKILAEMLKPFQEQLLGTGLAIKDTEIGGKSKLDPSKSFISSKGKSDTFLKWIKTTTQNNKPESAEEKDAKCGSKVKRILSFEDSHEKTGITKRNKAVVNAGAIRSESGSEVDLEKNEHQQRIRIELKPDPGLQEPSLQFSSGDLLKFKLTMYFQDNLKEMLDHHVEIDFVQNFQCKTVTQKNSCQCRRITKILNRTSVGVLRWEKGIHISGQQFALSWVPYTIPLLADEEKAGSESGEEKDHGHLPEGKLDNKFKVTNSQFELQVRFYETVTNSSSDEESHPVLAACSCFPINITTTSDANSEPSQYDDFLLGLQDEEEDDFVKKESESKTEKSSGRMLTLTKSLSATQFDV